MLKISPQALSLSVKKLKIRIYDKNYCTVFTSSLFNCSACSDTSSSPYQQAVHTERTEVLQVVNAFVFSCRRILVFLFSSVPCVGLLTRIML